MRRKKSHFLSIVLVVFLTWLTWYKALGQGFDVEGFQYFSLRGNSDWRGLEIEGLKLILTFDTFALLIAHFLTFIFKDGIQAYQVFMLFTACLVNLAYYFLVYELTGKKAIALAAFAFFGLNFISAYEFFGSGTYQFFLQRIPNLLLVFPSLWLLVRFVKGKTGRSNYLWAVFLWWFSLLLAQFSLFLLPLFVLWAFFYWWFETKRTHSELISICLKTLPFVIGGVFFYWLDKLQFYSRPHWWIAQRGGFFHFISHPQAWLGSFAYQLTWITLPRKVILFFSEPQYREPLIWAAIPSAFIYLIAAFYLYRRGKALRGPFFAALFFIPLSLFLNTYVCLYQIDQLYWSSRYFYVPFMGLAMVLAIFLYSFFYQKSGLSKWLFFTLTGLWIVGINIYSALTYLDKMVWAPKSQIQWWPFLAALAFFGLLFFSFWDKKNLIGQCLFFALVVWWVYSNINLIWTKMDEEQWKHTAIRETIQYVKENSLSFPDDALVVMPKVIEPDGLTFCQRFYGRGQMRFEPIYTEWEKLLDEDFDLKKLIVIDYDYENQQILDRSEEFREKLKKS